MSTSAVSPERRAIRVFLTALTISLILLGLFAFRSLVLVAFIGVLLGVLPEPLIRTLKERARIPNGLSVVGLAAVVLLAAGGLGYGIYTSLAPEIERLSEQTPSILEKLGHQVEALVARFPWLESESEKMDVGGMAQQAAEMLTKTVKVGAESLAGVVVILMIAIFVAANFSSYARGMLTLFPPERRERMAALGHGSVRVVRRWFLGQMLVVAISGVLTGLAMFLIGIDYWLLIAALTIILDFVPFIGAVLTGVIASLLTLGTEPEKVWWVVLAYLCIQQIESDVILPIVMKGTNRLPEAQLLVFVLIMGTAFGLVGLFLAPPLFAILHHLYLHAYVPWVERRSG